MPDDFQPNYELIANRKGKRATDEEKAEIYRCSKHMSMAKIIEITQRSEDSIRKYVNQMSAGTEATMRAQAEAYQHMVAPPAPQQRAAPDQHYYDDDDYDDDDYENPPSARRPPPPPPPEAPEFEIDLDDLFDDDDDVEPDEENALAKKLYVLLIQKKAVKGADAAETAADIARTYAMYPNYHNQPATVEFLKGHDVKQMKAETIASLLFGWLTQQQNKGPRFSPGLVPGYPGMPPGSPPGFNQFQQPWGGGYTGYGVPGHQPGQYPYPWPQPPMPNMQQGKQISKDDVVKAVQDAIQKNNEEWQRRWEAENAKREKDDEKRAHKEEMDDLRAANQRLEARITDLSTNPQTAPPDGNYEAVETPVFDEEGNVIRVNTTYRRLEDPVVKEMNQKYDDLLAEFKEERKEYKAEMKAMLEAKGQLEIEKLKAESAGEIDLWKEKKAHLDDLRDKMADADKELYAKEKELMEMKYKKSDDQPLELQKVDKQIEFLREAKNQARDFRKDAMKFIMVMSGKGRPEGVVEEQWTDEELAGMK